MFVWAFSYYAAYTLVAAMAAHLLACAGKDLDAQADIWGALLQLLGIFTIAYGLNAKLREHSGAGLLKTLWVSTKDAFKIMPLPWITLRTITARMDAGELKLSGGHSHGTVSPPPNATIEQRLNALESNYLLLSASNFNLETRADEQDRKIDALADNMERHRVSLAESIRASAIGGYSIEIIGALLLSVGVWYGTMPLLTPMACSVLFGG